MKTVAMCVLMALALMGCKEDAETGEGAQSGGEALLESGFWSNENCFEFARKSALMYTNLGWDEERVEELRQERYDNCLEMPESQQECLAEADSMRAQGRCYP